MGKAYSYDLRTKVIEAIDRAMKKIDASRTFNLSRNPINLWLKKRELTGDYEEKKGYQRGYGHKIKNWSKFRKQAKKNGALPQAEMAEAWDEKISQRTISRGLKKLGLTRKKRLTGMKNDLKKKDLNS